jgi:hypothetical protein
MTAFIESPQGCVTASMHMTVIDGSPRQVCSMS